jgi:3-hydroxyisobutyrate dehydrogenase
MSDTRVAFLGTGIMGRPMAGNLLKAGFPVTAYNRTVEKVKPLAEAGATVARSIGECVKDAHVIISCVPDSPDVEAVYLGEGGVAVSAPRGALAIDMSTVAPATARKVASVLAQRGIAFLDAPVSGGEWGAINGTLVIMVGGDADAVRQADPVFRAMGKSVVHCGPSGAGQTTKLCNQILCAVNLMAACEAMVFAEKADLDVAKMLEAVSGGAAGSWVISNLAPRMLKGDFAPGFMVDLQQKDMRLVFEAARETLASLPGTALATQLMTGNQAWGEERLGTQALIRMLRRLNAMDADGPRAG